MNIFSALRVYAGKWSEKEVRAFAPEEVAAVEKAEVVESQYGFSVCFFMKDGCQKYIPLSRDSVACEGDAVDLSKAKILILEKEGSEDIVRVEI